MSEPAEVDRPQKDRSPSFPFIPLQTAIERLTAYEQTFGRHDTPANKVGRAWKMKDGSSQAFQTLAALKSFGFVDYRGSGPSRATFLTDDARRYLRAHQDSIRRQVVTHAALKPKIIERFWREWGPDRPIDDVCIDTLHFQHGFTQSAAETFLRVYDATIAFAGLASAPNGSDADDEDVGGDPAPEVEVGDFVQVEMNGVLALAKAERVRAVQEHDGKLWFYIENSEAAVPAEQIRLEKKGAPVQAAGPPPIPITFSSANPPPRSAADGWKEERLIDDAGEETLLTYKGELTVSRYEFIRDYLEFRIGRLKK